MKFVYTRSPHDDALNEAFKSAVVEEQPQKINCVILAFVNRSGSNYIADALKTTGRFAGFEEILNDPVMRRLASAYNTSAFGEYLKRVHQEQVGTSARIWGLKAAWFQIAMLMRTKAIPNLLSPKVVLVRRKDVVGQAISFLIAEQTQRWTALQEGNKSVDIKYDGARILNHLRSMYNSYAMLDQVVALAGLPTYTITYEDFIDRPNGVLADLGIGLTGQALLPRMENLKLSLQRNDLNQEFRLRFLAEAETMDWSCS